MIGDGRGLVAERGTAEVVLLLRINMEVWARPQRDDRLDLVGVLECVSQDNAATQRVSR